jgi:molybdopterin converting factor small subunit
MPVVVLVPGPLRPYAAGAARVVLEGAPPTVSAALAALGARHPGVRDRVLTEAGEVRPHVALFVGAENVRYTGGLDTPLAPDVEIAIRGERRIPGAAGHRLQSLECLPVERLARP